MHDDLIRARDDHAAATAGWRELMTGLSDQDANWKPTPARWSVAQCLDHVCIVTGEVLPALDAAVARAHERGVTGPGPYRYGPIGRWFLGAQAPGAAGAVRTPGRYAPSSSQLDVPATIARFEAVQAAFSATLEAADGVDLARVRAPSPAMALLRLQAGIWFRSLPVHALRHLAQAQRVRDEVRHPAG
jgi:hypothetical protein